MFPHSHKKSIGAACLLLVLSLLSVGLFSLTPTLSVVPAHAAESEPNAPHDTLVADFSNPNSEATTEISASAFVACLLKESTSGETISGAESAYLDSLPSDFAFGYSNAIPPRAVDVSYDHNTLTVTARPHAYTTVNGETVTWYPVAALLGEISIPLEAHGTDGTLQGTLSDIPESTGARVEIRYTSTISVPAAIADTFLNAAWNYADRLCSEQAAYDAHVKAYEAYCRYLSEKVTYDAALAEWQNYLVAKEKYDRLYAAYTAYEKEMAVYRERMEAYEAYVSALEDYKQKQAAYEAAYAAYVTELDAYNAALPAYEINQAQISQVADVLATLDSAFVYNSRGKQMYATLIGDTVATVVNRKDELVSLGKCDPKDIDTADRSTEVLQDLLTRYKNIQGLPARFAFYQQYYAEINQNFSALYGSLRSLYNNEIVKSTLINYEKLERYIEFLSQLYVIASGLDDTTNRAPSGAHDPNGWVVFGVYDREYYGNKPHYYDTELEPEQLPPDKNNANPAGITCPSAVLPKPTRPVMSMEKPIAPAEVTYPVLPDPVLKPTPPTPVSQPVAPTPVPNPGDPPIAPAYTTLQQDLMTAHQNGTLSHRTAIDTPLVFHSTYHRQFSLQNKRLVEFYDYDGQTLLYSTELEDGANIVFRQAIPSRPNTDKYTYSFAGWKDQDGNRLGSLGVVDERHEVFYASYTATLRTYTVTWLVDGQSTTTRATYGTTPQYNGTPTRPATEEHEYVFAGWRVPGEDGWTLSPSSVQGNVTYEAVFEPLTRRYTVTWVYGEGNMSETLWAYGTLPVPDKTPARTEDDRFLYEFIGWDNEPTEVSGDAIYTALYRALPILPAPDDKTEPQALILRDDVYLASVPDEGLPMDRLLSLALLRDRTIALTSADGALTLQLNHAVITHLDELGCARIHIQNRESLEKAIGEVDFSIDFLNGEGEKMVLSYPATLRFSGADHYTRVYGQVPAADGSDTPTAFTALPFTLEGTEVSVKIDRSMTLRFVGEYPIIPEPCEDAVLVADRTHAVADDTVTLTLTLSDDMTASLHVVGHSGTTYPVLRTADGSYTFTMPAEPVTVRADVSRKTFTVIFKVDNVVISEAVYHKGDTVLLPDDPAKAPAEGKVYTFIGWSPVVTVVTEDVVYTATFRESIQGDSQSYIPPDSRNRVYLLFIEAGLVLAVLIATPIVIVRLVKRRRKKKRATQEAQLADASSTRLDT